MTTAPDTSAGTHARWLPPTVVGAALLLGLGLGGGTYALWSDSGPTSQTTITTGDITVDTSIGGSVQTESWCAGSTIPCVASVGDQAVSNASQFLVRPGDTIVLSLPVTATLQGDNLNATLTATSSSTPAAPVTVSYQVFDQAGTTALSTPTPLGSVAQDIVVPGPLYVIGESNTPVTYNYTVKVTVTFPASIADVFGLPGSTIQDLPSSYTVAADLGTLSVTLDQVRAGGGFN